jgi:hypothetical protein
MVTVDEPTVELPLVARAHRAIEPLHSHAYFAPEHDERLTAAGLRPGRMCYFAGRTAPMGPVGPGVVTATFYNFAPALVARHVPRAWTLAAPGRVLEARLDAARASLTRLLGGPDALATGEVADAVAELTDLLAEACGALTAEARPLYAANADLPWPEDPAGRLWHAVTLLREHRGDGHLACLLRAGLSGLEALVTHTATGRGFTLEAARATRGWSEEEWDATVGRLRDRGLLDADGALTDDGAGLRAEVEAGTDVLSTAPWERLGAERTARVTELARGLARRLVAAGAYPAGVLASR